MEPTISNVEILPFPPKNGFLGFASITIDNKFYLSDIALFSRMDGSIRIGFPIKKLNNGTAMPIFRPLSHETEAEIEAAIQKKYETLLMSSSGTIKESTNDFSESYPNSKKSI